MLFVSDKHLGLKKLKDILKSDYSDNLSNIENVLNELKNEYITLNKLYKIKFVADGWTFTTKSEYSL
ncbi:MAG: SMC-Scp complex subunit ScpB [Endomicrobium sp.]|nr:SMC-Scp complex subunit ScpB [Endomicrobium sp.]